MAFFLLVIFTLFIVKYKTLSLYRFKLQIGVCVYFFLVITSYVLTVYLSKKLDREHYRFQRADGLVGLIVSEPKLSGGILRFETDVKGSYYRDKNYISSGKLLVALRVDTIAPIVLNYGDLVVIPALYDSIEPPYNPAQFDYRQFLAKKQIYYQTLLTPEKLILIKRNKGNPVITFSLRLRRDLVRQFYTYLPDKNAAAFASTLILGYRAELSSELIEAYAKTGTMHVLSVSGMHVGIVFMVLSFLLGFMNKNRGLRLSRALVIISVVWFYALLTGFSAPACRAAVMLSFIVIGKALNKSQNTYNLIAISAFFLLLYNPFFLFDAGFQLSYVAVTGLVYFHPKIYQMIYLKNRLLDCCWSYCALSIAAQLATFPISIYYFHQFPVYFLLSNLFIVLPVAVIMYAGIIFMLIPLPGVLCQLGIILNWLITFTNNILFYIENLPFSSWDGLWINTFQFILLYLILFCLILKVSFGHNIRLPLYTVLTVFCMSISVLAVRNYDRHELIFYNLRKYTAVAHLYRGRSVVITDLDASDKLTGFSVLPGLQSKGSATEMFLTSGKSFSGQYFYAAANFYQFGSYRILRWDNQLDHLKFNRKITVDALFVSGNPHSSVQDMKEWVNFSRLIIDAGNPDYKINNWIEEARKMGITYYLLKKNPAYVVKL